jgi:hypothetical protein
MQNSANNNMLLTSYNFNQNMKDNILSMYSSTSFDKNFKTFYKGDPYNFDIETNFTKDKKDKEMNNYQKNGLITIDEENNKKQMLNINPLKKPTNKNEINLQSQQQFLVSERTPPKTKRTHGSQAPIRNNNVYTNDDTYKLLQSKYGSFKSNNTNNKAFTNMKDFQLPSISSKNFSLKKIIK